MSKAQAIMENLFMENQYQDQKQDEHKLKLIRKELMTRHPEEQKRWEFKDYGVIAKFQYSNVYETDVLGLNEFLYDLGLLESVARFDITEKKEPEIFNKLSPYRLDPTHFVKFNPKKGLVNKEEEDFSHFNNEQLIFIWSKTKSNFDYAEIAVENAKEEMMECEVLKKNKKIVCEFGSASLIANKPSYDMDNLSRELGGDFIIQNAKVNMDILEKYITRGVITKNEILSFRKVIDIKEKYVVTFANTESIQSEMLYNRKMIAAKNIRWKVK